ncbi:hypothetical protein QEH59_05735 [Coraliomargarita sp. SDUM461004]|uniref:Uncharacterized protein n=1 Tax=Thalassobacterium sedimentorum TaxID=3041258 RepID=A0ABU1AJ72_9BACT|nr:hypothetical protein [Coraliomargarita sp. SDUM461004]MDQ8193915.1 hypothetical protein [Coraliomargarita sp. SDUM461004]
MNRKLLKIALLIISCCQLNAESLQLSLVPDKWEVSQSTITNSKQNTLTVKSINNSIWLSHKDLVSYVEGSVATLEYSLRSGNLVIQADWFNAEGNYLKTTNLHKSTSESKATSFKINKALPDTDSAYYRLKIWVEAEMPNLQIYTLELSTQTTNQAALLQASQDFEPTQEIDITFNQDGSLQFKLINSDTVKTLHTLKQFSIQEQNTLDIQLETITESSAFSVQLLLWDTAGTYLGYVDALKDMTEPNTVHIDLDNYQLPNGAFTYSIKFWLTGHSETAAILRVVSN